MDYSQFLMMKEELSLIAVILILFVADLFMSPDAHKRDGKPVLNTMLPVALLVIHTVITAIPGPVAEAFGGMYLNTPAQHIVKSVLSIGTIIVFLMAHEWMRREDALVKQGEFYFLTLSTLLGMYFMISAGHFLMFFIGLEMASVPMAALVAFDKYRHHSAEAGAKYILTALFSSGLLLFGLSMIYGTTGTLYFSDLPARMDGSALQVMAFVFFFAGMGFKISLVPFHLWTADVYEGAPSTVTAYLSVVSKGSAAFVLMVVLFKVFAPMVDAWQTVLYTVTVLSITVANLFAILMALAMSVMSDAVRALHLGALWICSMVSSLRNLASSAGISCWLNTAPPRLASNPGTSCISPYLSMMVAAPDASGSMVV